jgi:hypothetical protein
MNQSDDGGQVRKLVASSGPWPFVTRREFRHADESLGVWLSRGHRKGLVPGPGSDQNHKVLSWLWAPGEAN